MKETIGLFVTERQITILEKAMDALDDIAQDGGADDVTEEEFNDIDRLLRDAKVRR